MKMELTAPGRVGEARVSEFVASNIIVIPYRGLT
jgi:hypothetical protein